MAKVLIVPDLHAPFNHVNSLKFIKSVAEEVKPDEIVFIGDLVDNHALSRYPTDPDGLSAKEEWKAALTELKRFYRAFPKAKWVLGNHDRRYYSKAYEAGIPKGMLKDFREVYQIPDGWEFGSEFIIDNVKYIHGEAAGGARGWQNACVALGQSVVFGHYHTIGGVAYRRGVNQQLFSLAVGCLIDEESYAFAYGKMNFTRPVLGCGLVDEGKTAAFVPFDFSDRSLRRKRREII